VLENRELKVIFESKGEEVAGDWKRLRNEELYNMYTSPDFIIRVMRWGARNIHE